MQKTDKAVVAAQQWLIPKNQTLYSGHKPQKLTFSYTLLFSSVEKLALRTRPVSIYLVQ
jgi:hypothetical protein